MNRDPAAGGLSSHAFAVEMLEEAPCGIAATCPDGTIITANRTLARWVDRSMADLTGSVRLQDLMTLPGRMFYETHVSPMLRLQGFVREISCQLRRPRADPLPVLLNAVVRRGDTGQLLRVDYTLFDATERRLYEQSLRAARQEAEQLAAIVTSSPDGIIRVERDGTVLRWNQGAERLCGVSSAQAVSRRIETLVDLPDAPGWFAEAVEASAEKGVHRFEAVLAGGADIEVTVSPIREPADLGAGATFSVMLRDISEIVAAKEQTRLVIGELNHRVKNILSVVLSIARQTLPKDESASVGNFVQRLHALSRAHDLLVASDWRDISLSDLLSVTAEEAGGRDRLDYEGPLVRLQPKQAVALALALHELVTNSFKYGALSHRDGRVEVRWSLGDGSLEFTWTEAGGPPVEEPRHRGFGTKVIERALTSEFGGTVDLEFRPAGLVLHARLGRPR